MEATDIVLRPMQKDLIMGPTRYSLGFNILAMFRK